ncbi:glycosyltransferase [Cellulomonas chengniuliangii]|uniref:Glycosyltransferase n=1 Tax=Cellulomonas chengniuliangii TaxID=2968084 RepID=A0ABY5KZG1_9CELL|nr:glycosyltransferase [Cellulomonas chengniuliangii]MCC2310060.1 glycosyltransferase [Cellulomonas chengniuliangii]UUI74545.1 glycosyltransferase [Cellulomonas chengniuliangii]
MLTDYDAAVYHLGDHAPNHRDIWLASLAVPGVVVIHDVSLSNLFHGYLLDRGDYAEEFGRWYGPDIGDRTRRVLDGSGEAAPWNDGDGMTFPFLSLAASGARHLIAHSQYAAGALATTALAEVDVIGLPLLTQRSGGLDREALGLPRDVPIILQAGVLNVNKRIDVVVEAVAELLATRAVHLVVAGKDGGVSMEQVTAWAERAGMASSFTAFSSPSDEVMASLREHATVATVLREPCLEGASYALLESLDAGLPVVAVAEGSYREVVGSFMRHVEAPPTAVPVAAALDSILGSDLPEASKAARLHVRAHHEPAGYARRVMEVLEADRDAEIRHQLTSSLGGVLLSLGLSEDLRVVEAVSQRVEDLFGGEPRVLPHVADRAGANPTLSHPR